MDFITPYDILQTYMHLIRKRIVNKGDKADDRCVAKIEELSLLLIRMSMQNAQFTSFSTTMIVYTCIQAACTLLQLERRSDENFSFFYSEFKRSFQKMAYDIERSIPEEQRPRDLSTQAGQTVNILAEKIIEFYKHFDSWHCGLN